MLLGFLSQNKSSFFLLGHVVIPLSVLEFVRKPLVDAFIFDEACFPNFVHENFNDKDMLLKEAFAEVCCEIFELSFDILLIDDGANFRKNVKNGTEFFDLVHGIVEPIFRENTAMFKKNVNRNSVGWVVERVDDALRLP